MRRGQVLFTYLHLAASLPCTNAVLAAGITAIAYETVQDRGGSLPLLAPMSRWPVGWLHRLVPATSRPRREGEAF